MPAIARFCQLTDMTASKSAVPSEGCGHCENEPQKSAKAQLEWFHASARLPSSQLILAVKPDNVTHRRPRHPLIKHDR